MTRGAWLAIVAQQNWPDPRLENKAILMHLSIRAHGFRAEGPRCDPQNLQVEAGETLPDTLPSSCQPVWAMLG